MDHVGGEVDDGQVGDVVKLSRKRDQPVAVGAQHPEPRAGPDLTRQRVLQKIGGSFSLRVDGPGPPHSGPYYVKKCNNSRKA